jgi:hypothetical protein
VCRLTCLATNERSREHLNPGIHHHSAEEAAPPPTLPNKQLTKYRKKKQNLVPGPLRPIKTSINQHVPTCNHQTLIMYSKNEKATSRSDTTVIIFGRLSEFFSHLVILACRPSTSSRSPSTFSGNPSTFSQLLSHPVTHACSWSKRTTTSAWDL